MNQPAPDPDTSLGERFPRTPQQMSELRAAGVTAAKRMLAFIDASPTPFHAVDNIAAQLREDGFQQLSEREAWGLMPGYRRFVIRDASTIIAFVVGKRAPAEAGFRIIGAHTDSPNLRVKPQPAVTRKGFLQLGVEVYGGALLSTWLDRDLSIAGRIMVQNDGRLTSRLVDLRRPVARVSNVAIHLNRKVNQDGLVLNKQRHMVPVIGLGDDDLDIMAELAASLGVDAGEVVGSDLSLYDTQKGSLGGLKDEFVYSARLDNLASCHAAAEAICGTPDNLEATAVVALYDHEECGSRSAIGAASNVLRDVLDRISLAYPGEQAQAFPRAMASSLLLSADMAHAIHPNYTDKHDREHAPLLNRGLVIKSNSNQAYTSNSVSSAHFAKLCAEAGYEAQHFVSRSDMPCGSTIGPITAAKLGVQSVDIGAPMLSMHSCREVAGSLDVHLMLQTFSKYLAGDAPQHPAPVPPPPVG